MAGSGVFGYEVLALRTPTLPPATTTNALLLWGTRLLVVEPASPHGDEQARLRAAIAAHRSAGRTVEAVVVTHHHADHVADARRLADEVGAPLAAHPETAERLPFTVDLPVEDGHHFELGERVTVRALFTPGHAPGHLVLLETAGRIGHAGDLVAGEGTILVDPGDGGDMAAYLDSLARLARCAPARLVPAHGPTIDDPVAKLHGYIAHRRMREQKVLAALADGRPHRLDELVPKVYDDVARALLPLARMSLHAHLVKLEAEGRVLRRASGYVGLDHLGLPVASGSDKPR